MVKALSSLRRKCAMNRPIQSSVRYYIRLWHLMIIVNWLTSFPRRVDKELIQHGIVAVTFFSGAGNGRLIVDIILLISNSCDTCLNCRIIITVLVILHCTAIDLLLGISSAITRHWRWKLVPSNLKLMAFTLVMWVGGIGSLRECLTAIIINKGTTPCINSVIWWLLHLRIYFVDDLRLLIYIFLFGS